MKYLTWLLPLGFYIHQNNYFGWNLLPKSDAELIADGIVYLLIVLVGIFCKADFGINVTNTTVDLRKAQEK